jgi:hypothetical protein
MTDVIAQRIGRYVLDGSDDDLKRLLRIPTSSPIPIDTSTIGIGEGDREARLAAHRHERVYVDAADGDVYGGKVDHNRAPDDESPPR